MLEDNIGQHCELPECRQRDFMPFECQYCGEIFCGEHRRPEDHRCSVGGDRDQLYVIICPICETRIQQRANEDADQLWRQHSSSGACDREAKIKAERDKAEAGLIKVCQVAKCKKRLTHINRQQCLRCRMEVCMAHRLPELHQCQQSITSDPRLARSKLLQLNQNKKPAAAQQAAATIPQQRHQQQQQQYQQPQNMAAMSSGLVSTSSELEQQQRLLQQFQFGGSVPQQPKQFGVVLPEVCHVCQARFRDVMELIAHSEAAHTNNNTGSQSQQQPSYAAQGASPQVPQNQQQTANSSRKEQQRCPECNQAFAITELPRHMQQDHYIF